MDEVELVGQIAQLRLASRTDGRPSVAGSRHHPPRKVSSMNLALNARNRVSIMLTLFFLV